MVDQLKSNLEDEFLAKNEGHQQDQARLFNVFDIVLEQCQEPLGCEVVWQDLILRQKDVYLGHKVV